MKHTKKTIVKLLSTNGGLTTGELSEMLGISTTAVRRHLNALEAGKVVNHRVEQRGMGRPNFVYELVDSLPAVFNQSFNAFVASVLSELEGLGQDRSAREVFEERQAGRHQKYIDLTEGATLNDRVACLARLMESEGRIATWQQLNENCFILREHNCPFHRLNGSFDHPCRREVSLLETTLQADVERVNHIMQGDVACVYRIECNGNGNRCQKKDETARRNGRNAMQSEERHAALRMAVT
jgi:predicted ArsR family transcriptional regulator